MDWFGVSAASVRDVYLARGLLHVERALKLEGFGCRTRGWQSGEHDRGFGLDVTFPQFAKRLAFIVMLSLSCVLAACGQSMTQRIKVTVTVEDNGTLYTGTAVQQWTCTGDLYVGDKFIGTGGCELKAEAIPIKIGDKGWAFMLLSGNEQDGFRAPYYPGAIQAGRSKVSPQLPWSVPFDKAPVFVRFRDLKDRATVELVRPNAFSEAFGKGVGLVSIKCEPTNDWLTRGKVRKLLPWLDELGTLVIDLSAPGQPRSLISQISELNFVWK
jgi:hypothetical protein